MPDKQSQAELEVKIRQLEEKLQEQERTLKAASDWPVSAKTGGNASCPLIQSQPPVYLF